jgi:hypothetical protein
LTSALKAPINWAEEKMSANDDEKDPPVLPEATVVRPKVGLDWSRVRRLIKRGLVAALVTSLTLGAVTLLALSFKSCEKRKAAECTATDGMSIDRIVRIKRIEHGNRMIYTRRSDSAKVDISTTQGCTLRFEEDAPADKAMWAVEHDRMESHACKCELTFHVHSMTDPNVE